MKNIVSLLVITTLLISCGEKQVDVDKLIASGDIEAIKEAQTQLKDESTELQLKLKKLNTVIENAEKKNNGPLVSTQKVTDTLFNHFLEIQGNVETKQNVMISAEYSGVLSRVFVKEGDKVTKGQVLARIDDGGLGSQLAQLETQAQLNKTTFERQKRLWDQNIGSEIQYLQAKATYEASQSQVNQLKSQLGKTTVNAPFSGTIDQVMTEQGSAVMPGTQLYRIVNLSDMYITAEVPESYLGTVNIGKTVEVDFPVLNKNIESKIRQTSNFINPANRSFTIEVAVPNEEKSIKPNLTAKLKINDYTSENAILIPLSVISENAEGEQYVYVATSGTENNTIAKRVIVKTGKAQGDKIEVLTGLNAGDEIIVQGARSVQDNQEIRILNN
ncbi:efflux RND transporter periplasmic adaptor subunit [Leeuwenhoekiella sp. W20_SRS_FM14]|uniref:efflux RND transporter periplasmic adaptor subunit n=1 Tax=Leeuwenhoekiella sp. W20_SRS_FM14 TaxID=3240270 RepID=UPI003F9AD6FC